jgi:hypothetical protein
MQTAQRAHHGKFILPIELGGERCNLALGKLVNGLLELLLSIIEEALGHGIPQIG